MNLIKNFFTKKKINVDAEELTWRRDKPANDQPFYPSDRAMGRKNFETRPNSDDRKVEENDFQVPEPAKTTGINHPTWLLPSSNKLNAYNEPVSKYVDYSRPRNSSQGNKRYSRRSGNNNDVENSPQVSRPIKNFEEPNQNLLDVPNFGALNYSNKFQETGNYLSKDQEFKRNFRGNSAYRKRNQVENPRLKEYYELG